MRSIRLTQNALEDFESIRDYTMETYGKEQHAAYSRLIDQALEDIRLDPERTGSKPHPEISSETRSYRIALSKDRAGGEVKNPRHLIFYFDDNKEVVVVTRILHDSRDFKRHLGREDIERERGGGGRSR